MKTITQSPNHFYGTHGEFEIIVRRKAAGSPWQCMVINGDGVFEIDCQADADLTKQQAIAETLMFL